MCLPAHHAPGTLVEVVDRDGRFAGRGIYNRKSQIAVRLLTEDPAQPLDDDFFDALLDQAIDYRRQVLALDALTDAYRVVNAEGDGLSGLVVDRFGDFLVVQIFSAGWVRRLKWLLPALKRRFAGAVVLLKAEALAEEREGFKLRDFEAERLGDERLRSVVSEGALRFQVDLRYGQKTGFFCDQREQRLRVRALAGGRQVLDGCSYSGGFALNAARGGAASVTAVDLDEKAVELARANTALNRLEVDCVHADIFSYLRAERARGRQFDLIILDPPKFAAGKAEVAAALGRYRDLNELAARVLADGGTLITCSCSGALPPRRFEAAVLAGARKAGVELTLLEAATAAADHTTRPEFPEGRYLKVLTCRARRR